MKLYAKDIIKIAQSQVGYLEKKSNKNLDDFTKNAGSLNYTKYARDYEKFAGADLQAQSWCDMFLDWCFVQAFGQANAKNLLGGFSAYTPTSANYFNNMKQWFTNSPKVGDVIFFKNTTRICHTGIVTKVDSNYIYTIEGNTSSGTSVVSNGGGVFSKRYLLSNGRIAGYGRPKYDAEVSSTSTIAATTTIATVYHTVKKGDTLSKISQQYLGGAQRYTEIMVLNGLKSTVINIGQKLRIK